MQTICNGLYLYSANGNSATLNSTALSTAANFGKTTMRISKKAKLAASVAALSDVANVPSTALTTSPAVQSHAASVSETPVSNAIVPVSGITIDNDTGETVQPTATEATPDARVLRAERIAADRAAVRALYSNFEQLRASVPVKPLSAFKLQTTTAHPITRGATNRQAYAIAVAFAAAGVKLADGASAPRVFEIDGRPSAIENGVLRDAVSAGLITVTGATPEAEILTIADKRNATLRGLLGAALCKAARI